MDGLTSGPAAPFEVRLGSDSGRDDVPAPAETDWLEPNSAYYWKLVVDDGQGGTVESELRRFRTK